MTSMLSQIKALQAMTVGQLRDEWLRLYGEPTRSRNRDFLWRRLAWRLQELALGGLSDTAKSKIIELAHARFVRSQVPKGFDPLVTARPPKTRRDPRLPRPGSTLTRRYRDQEIRVLILDDGFEWNGRRFGSLSEVARAVTGQHWNGPLFFGLRKRAR